MLEVKISREAYTSIVKMFDTLVPGWVDLRKGTPTSSLMGKGLAAAAQRITNMTQAEVHHEGSGGFFQALLLHPLTPETIAADHTDQTPPMPRAEGFNTPIEVDCNDGELLDWLDVHSRMAVVEGTTHENPHGEHVANEWSIRWPTYSLREAIQQHMNRQKPGETTNTRLAPPPNAEKPAAPEPRTAEDKYVEEQNAPWGNESATAFQSRLNDQLLKTKTGKDSVEAEDEDEDESDEISWSGALPPRTRSDKAKIAKVPVPATPTDSIALVLEAWDHGQFSGAYLVKYAMFPPVHRALTELLTWLAYNHTALSYVSSPRVPTVQAARPRQPLLKFYGVSTTHDLVAAQERHVQKLQTSIDGLKRQVRDLNPPAVPRRPRGG